MKKCTRCKQIKNEIDFYPSQKRSWCKMCFQEYLREYTKKYPELIRGYRIKALRKYYQKHRKTILEDMYNRRCPQRKRAGHKVEKAIKTGKLKKPNVCQICGSEERLEGAHIGHNYDQPLEVIFICKSCHFKQDNRKLSFAGRTHN